MHGAPCCPPPSTQSRGPGRVRKGSSAREAGVPALPLRSRLTGPVAPKLSAPLGLSQWIPHFPGGLGSHWETLGVPRDQLRILE